MDRPIIVITGRERPHELALLAFSAVAGALFLAGVPVPPSIVESMRPPWNVLWCAGLALSGIVGLVGCYWRGNLIVALGVERTGLLFNAACYFTYAVMVFTFNGWNAFFAAGFCVSVAVADVARSLRISNDLRNIGKGIRDAH